MFVFVREKSFDLIHQPIAFICVKRQNLTETSVCKFMDVWRHSSPV